MNFAENQKGIKVKYVYSACIVTTTKDLKILHDPWFTEGIFDGSWFQFPPVDDPLKSIGDVDLIYVSHLHQDHYDPRFLQNYFSRYGRKEIIIANHNPNYLKKLIEEDGFDAKVISNPMIVGDTTIEIIPHLTGDINDIDSAITIATKDENKTHYLVNTNDVIFDEEYVIKFKNSLKYPVDILLCGYTGAGPYPQTYFDLDDPELVKEAHYKKKKFLLRYKLLVSTINAKINIPFAGKYILGGKLAKLNNFRGVSDQVEVLDIDKNAIVLSDNGGSIDTLSLKPTSVRTEAYDTNAIEEFVKNLSRKQMNYERLLNLEECWQIPYERLVKIAYKNALQKSNCYKDYFYCIKLQSNDWMVLNTNNESAFLKKANKEEVCSFIPRSEIYIDARYLFGLLTRVYHWNNAEIGSQFEVRRFPNVLDQRARDFLNYFHI